MILLLTLINGTSHTCFLFSVISSQSQVKSAIGNVIKSYVTYLSIIILEQYSKQDHQRI